VAIIGTNKRKTVRAAIGRTEKHQNGFIVDASGSFATPGSVYLTGRLSMSMIQGEMTLVAGIVNNNDVVIGSDGLILNSGNRFTERHLKSARLNDSLCVAFSGDLYGASMVLSRLMKRPEWKEAGKICEFWESSGQTINYDIEEAVSIISTVVHEIYAAPSLKNVQKNGIGIMLAGKMKGKPYLWACSQEEGNGDLKILEGDSGDITLGVARPTSIEEQYRHFLAQGAGLADEAVVSAIRLVARTVSDKVNGNICIRQLSAQFRRDWRIVPNSSRERDP
jgi:hypothetical protein